MGGNLSRAPRVSFSPVTADRWNDLEALFGERGACGGCWCMAWRLPRRDWEAGKGETNRRALRAIVAAGHTPGVLAYRGNEPVGWCAVAPRHEYVSLAGSRILRPVDDTPVWSISCLFLRKDHRRVGLSSRLLRAAVDLAATKGAQVVEGYPVEPYRADAPAAFLWTGVPSAFLHAGFSEVARRSRTRPIMRFEIARRRRGASR